MCPPRLEPWLPLSFTKGFHRFSMGFTGSRRVLILPYRRVFILPHANLHFNKGFKGFQVYRKISGGVFLFCHTQTLVSPRAFKVFNGFHGLITENTQHIRKTNGFRASAHHEIPLMFLVQIWDFGIFG